MGIVPARFPLDLSRASITPIGQNASLVMQLRDAHPGIEVWARLRPGASLAEAGTELALIGRRLAAQYPKTNAGRGFVAQPLRSELVDQLAGDAKSTLWMLLGAVTLVLLIACVNVASLLLARAVSRERELAMRSRLAPAAADWCANA